MNESCLSLEEVGIVFGQFRRLHLVFRAHVGKLIGLVLGQQLQDNRKAFNWGLPVPMALSVALAGLQGSCWQTPWPCLGAKTAWVRNIRLSLRCFQGYHVSLYWSGAEI